MLRRIKFDDQIRNKRRIKKKTLETIPFHFTSLFAAFSLCFVGGRKKEIELQAGVTAEMPILFLCLLAKTRGKRKGTVNKSKRAELNVIVHAILSESWVKRDFSVRDLEKGVEVL